MDVYEEQVANDEEVTPTPRLAAFLDALVERLPDDPIVEPPRNPWAFMPLRRDAGGPIAILHVRHDHVGTVMDVVPALAREHGLVCYDLQADVLV